MLIKFQSTIRRRNVEVKKRNNSRHDDKEIAYRKTQFDFSLSVTLLFVVVVLGDDIPASRPVNSVFCNGDQHRHHQQKRQTFYLPLPSSKMMNQVEQKSPVSDWRCHTMIISITGWWIWMDQKLVLHCPPLLILLWFFSGQKITKRHGPVSDAKCETLLPY